MAEMDVQRYGQDGGMPAKIRYPTDSREIINLGIVQLLRESGKIPWQTRKAAAEQRLWSD